MRVVSYNLNGVRSACGKGLLRFVQKDGADFYCFQETRASGEQVEECFAPLLRQNGENNPYYLYHKEGERKGYSGVAILTKQEPICVFDWEYPVDTEGRVLALVYDKFILVSYYTPNGGSRLDFKLQFMQQMLEKFEDFLAEGKDLIVCTDFNISYSPLDVSDPKRCSKISGYLPVERELFGRYLGAGFVDSFRKVFPFVQRYTWSSYSAKKLGNEVGTLYTFDYVIVSKALAEYILDAGVLLDVTCSDHYPVFTEFAQID